MKMRIGHRIFDITNKDIVVSSKNICYVATQTYFNNWCNVKPTMSKRQFKKLLKENVLQLFCTKKHIKDKDGKQCYLSYYNFCIENMKTKKKESAKNENENRQKKV